MKANGARHIERTSVAKRFALSRGLVAAALCLTAGIAEPGRAEETTHGIGKPADSSAFRVALDSRQTMVAGAPTGQSSEARFRGPTAGRVALDQPQCSICLGGPASVTWNGSSGSFHVDRIANYRSSSSGYSGPLDLKVILTSSLPVFGQTVNYSAFSSALSFSPLQAGYQYTPVDSGTIAFLGSSILPGEYWQLLFLREYVGSTWYYTDWILMDKKVSCSGSGCTTVSPPPSCTEDAYTMCLAGGRYRVTGRWKNQYAGGAQATLSKAKLTDVTGAFWIADANTYEFMVRISTATDNGRAWVSILTFTDVEFWVAITDVTNGQSKEYHSNPGNRTLIFDPSFFVYP